jgi:hypothetical protein
MIHFMVVDIPSGFTQQLAFGCFGFDISASEGVEIEGAALTKPHGCAAFQYGATVAADMLQAPPATILQFSVSGPGALFHSVFLRAQSM